MPKRRLVSLLVLILLGTVLLSPRIHSLWAFPAQMRVIVGDNHELNLDIPMHLYARSDQEGVLGLNGSALGLSAQRVSLAAPLVFEPLEPGRANIEFRLFGLIPFRRVAVDVVPEISLMPGGHSIGVLLEPDGMMIVGMVSVTDARGHSASPARAAGLEVGDIITRVAGVRVSTDSHIAELVAGEARAGRPVVVTVRRHGSELSFIVQPTLCRDTGRYRLGVLVRDITAGVGTLTFYDQMTMAYGALGHVISDAETGQPVNTHTGRIVSAFVSQIQPGRRGEPGEKMGTFIEGRNVLGTISHNSDFGIYGTLTAVPPGGLYAAPLPLALARQVKTAPATMLTVIEGDQMEAFAVEIRRLYSQSRPAPKGIVVQVVDDRLLSRTGGIVQGMSGSPLIQHGRIVGAVTHVFVNDPTRGYGMYAEWMAMEAGLIEQRSASRTDLAELARAAIAPIRRPRWAGR